MVVSAEESERRLQDFSLMEACPGLVYFIYDAKADIYTLGRVLYRDASNLEWEVPYGKLAYR